MSNVKSSNENCMKLNTILNVTIEELNNISNLRNIFFILETSKNENIQNIGIDYYDKLIKLLQTFIEALNYYGETQNKKCLEKLPIIYKHIKLYENRNNNGLFNDPIIQLLNTHFKSLKSL